MAHTRPDYSSKQKRSTIYGDMDNSELAARISKISSYDRAGNVLWYDDFESQHNSFYYASGGASAAHVHSNTYAWMGDTSMKLTAGPAVDDHIYMYKYLSPPSSSRLGVETNIFIGLYDAYIHVGLYGFTGTTRYDGYLRYDTGTGDIEYYNAAGGWTVIGNAEVRSPPHFLWTPFKVVVDWSTKEFVRAMVGHHNFSLAGVAMYGAASGTDPVMASRIGIVTNANADIDCYVDNLIITQNEP